MFLLSIGSDTNSKKQNISYIRTLFTATPRLLCFGVHALIKQGDISITGNWSSSFCSFPYPSNAD